MADDIRGATVNDGILDEEMFYNDNSATNVNGVEEDESFDQEMGENAESGGSDDEEQEEHHEFEIIDQVDSEEDGGEDGATGNDKDGGDSSDSDFDDAQLHEMLEKGIDKESILTPKDDQEPTDGNPIIKYKIVLQELDTDPFDILPEGWVCATHHCGMPVYLHKESRVCTMSMPYYLGNASTRRHDIPISAIPCLQYKTKLKSAEKDGILGSSSTAVTETTSPGETNLKTNETLNSNELQRTTQSCVNDSLQENGHSDSGVLNQSSQQKMWMVTQDSSWKCPSERKLEELHTGKTPCFENGITPVDGDDGIFTMQDNCNQNRIHPHSPAGENITVKLDSSKVEDGEILEEGEISNDSTTNTPSRNDFQNNDDKSTNIETEEKCVVTNSNPVVEETRSNGEGSELVTSTTSTLSSIKRKIEDLKRNAKQRKLMDGSAVATCTQNSENNIAVDMCQKDSEDKLRQHTVTIKSAEERAKESCLAANSVHNYCSRLFKFKTIAVKKYRTWRERRKHINETNRKRNKRPELPTDTKLITCPIVGENNVSGTSGGGKKKEFILNPSKKSYLCILHEYLQRTWKIKPSYVFKELENSKTPYSATVTINNVEYGTGLASSKKIAKQEAAKEALKILIPDIQLKLSDQDLKTAVSDFSFFDEVQIEDPRVYELGTKVGQPSPFQLLQECLRRNLGNSRLDTEYQVKTASTKNQKCEFVLTVGKHTATVVARNKRDGRQLAAQAILAKLHPHVPSWGSLLRLYANNAERPMEKIEEMNGIKTQLPNKAVLEKLRDEMRKLHEQKEAIQSMGKFLISSKDLPTGVACRIDLNGLQSSN